ncbi:LysR family transcriptional regulator [Cupriavidus basilensis]|uniref:LysR family transcriptional regulator n=1 Tax=Cupriavidus basilensis TaxID=68895 RepID=A0ABT6AQB7_9BURK|nr:LysR family transcriptional regulator [Cupriavidus basilensis]MDF3834798.1 LysR family transcriptional regulator [Cupriavidus basilensis]
MITIKQVEAFYWAAKLGTVQRAATKLHVTQSAATKRLQELERISAAPLFESSGRKAALTPKGQELLELCESFLAATARLEEIKASAKNVARVLHIGITELVALTWFPSLVRRLNSVYPHVTLQPDVDLSASLRDKVLDGRLDFAVLPEAYATPAMATVKLQSVKFSWICPVGAFDTGKVVSLQDLASLPLIEQDAGSGLTALCETLYAQAGIEPHRVSGSNSLVALAGLVEAGVGVSCVPLHLFDQEISQKRLQLVHTDPPAPSITYVASFLKQHQAALGYAVADIARQCCDFGPRHGQPRRRRPA